MGKQIVIISSTPRKGGNSDVLCDEFAKGAIAAGNTVEKIFLKEKEIGVCTGCGYCINHPGVCSRKDDMTTIKDQLIAADVIVLATPIYFYTMCGQLQTFIERNCFFYTELINKEFYYIMTAADGEIVRASCRERVYDIVYCTAGDVSIINNNLYMSANHMSASILSV